MKKEKINIFMLMVLLFAGVVSYRYLGYEVTKYNTTLFALNYDYGFISRGFLGTAYSVLNMMLPRDIMTYNCIYYFCILSTAIFYILLILFFANALTKASADKRKNLSYLIVSISILTFPMFVTTEMLGRLDTFLMIIVVLCLYCLMNDRCVWLVPVLCVIAMLVHQGFVFTNINLILVLLFYKAIKETDSRKYWIVFAITLISCSVLFIFFEFFSHANGSEIYASVVENAKRLSPTGDGYNISIINHEILGLAVYDSEIEYRKLAYQETAVFLAFAWPILLMGIKYIIDILKGKKGKECLAYLAVAAGGLTILPEIVLKVDFGRYAYYTFWYYLIITFVLIVWNDEHICGALEGIKNLIARFLPIPQLIFAYLMLMMPFHDIIYGDLIDKIKIFIFG